MVMLIIKRKEGVWGAFWAGGMQTREVYVIRDMNEWGVQENRDVGRVVQIELYEEWQI